MRAERLRELVTEQGPFASVYLDTSHDTEDATTQNELRWRAAHDQLAEAGADEETLSAVEHAVLDRPAVGRAGRAVIAAHGEALLVEDLPMPPANEVVRLSELPYLLPLLSSGQPAIAHVVVLADKVEGHLLAVDRDGRSTDPTDVQGRERPVENRAEETARHNAKDIAAQAVHLVERVDAELVVLAGTVSARTAISAELPDHVRRMVTEIDVDANRADLDSPEITGEVTRLLAQRQAEHDALLLDRLRTGQAHDNARAGFTEVVSALRSAAAEAVLITDPALADRTVWLGPDPSQVAVRTDELPEVAEELVERRADEAIPLAALATAADVVVLAGEAEMSDGIAVLLRF